MSLKIDIDTSTFIRFWLVILGFLFLAFFIGQAWTGLLAVGLAIFLALSIRPLGERINKLFLKKGKNDKEKLSYILGFSVVVLVIILVILVIGPVMINETTKFINQIPEMFENVLGGWDGINDFGKTFGIADAKGEILEAVSNSVNGVVQNLGNILGSIGNVLGVGAMSIVLTIFFLLEGPELYEALWKKLSGRKKDEKLIEFRKILSRMAGVVSAFMSRQVTIALLDGLVVTFVVFLLSIIFGFSAGLALPIGLISMLFYLIPMFGQFIGCLINTLILLVSNPIAGIIYAILYLVYSQVEGNVIAPKLQGTAMKLPPLIILVSIVIGTYAFGLIGAIIAIPIAGCVKILLEEYPKIKEIREKA